MYLLMSYGQVMTCSTACESIGLPLSLSGSTALCGKPQSLNQTHPGKRENEEKEGEGANSSFFSLFPDRNVLESVQINQQ